MCLDGHGCNCGSRGPLQKSQNTKRTKVNTMKNRKRAETTITVGSEPPVACAAMNNAGESAERWALHQSPSRRESHHCGIFALSPAARGLRHALSLVLFVVAVSLIAPSALLSQAAAPLPALLFAGSQTTVGTGLDAPYGVAVDGKGDVFIADSNRILKLSASGGAQTTIGSGLNFPAGVAVDGAGNVFVADEENTRVVEIAADGGAQTTVGTGLLTPTTWRWIDRVMSSSPIQATTVC